MNIALQLTQSASAARLALKPCAANEVKALKFLLVYEDSGTGVRAKHIMNQMVQGDHGGRHSAPVMFRFELLRMKEIWELAANESQTVDVLVVSARDGGSVPVEVKSWITYWLGLKGGHPRMIIASFDRSSFQSSDSELTMFYLRSLAEWADVELRIVFGDGPHEGLTPRLPDVSELPNQRTGAALAAVPRMQLHDNGRHFGLNE